MLPDSDSAIRFATRSTVPPFWVFLGWHFTHSERNGSVGLVNVVIGSVGTVGTTLGSVADQLSLRPITDDTLFEEILMEDLPTAFH